MKIDALVGMIGSLAMAAAAQAQTPSLGYEGVERAFDSDSYQVSPGASFEVFPINPTGKQRFCTTMEPMECYGPLPELDWTGQTVSIDTLPLDPGEPVRRIGAALEAFPIDAIRYFDPIQGENTPAGFTDFDWHWVHSDLPESPGALELFDKNGDGISDAFIVNVDASMVEDLHPSVQAFYSLSVVLRRLDGGYDNGQAFATVEGQQWSIDAEIGQTENLISIEQSPGRYILEFKRYGAVVDSVELNSPAPPQYPSSFDNENAPVILDDGFDRALSISVKETKFGPQSVNVSVARSARAQRAGATENAFETVALIGARARSRDGECIQRLDDIDGVIEEHILEVIDNVGTVEIDVRRMEPGRYGVARIGEAKPTPRGAPIRYGVPVVEIQYFEIPEIDASDRIRIAEEIVTGPESRIKDGPMYATYEYEIEWLGSDDLRVPGRIRVDAVAPASRLVSGPYVPSSIVDTVVFDDPGTVRRIKPGNFPGTYLSIRDASDLCEIQQRNCGNFVYGRIDLPADRALPIPKPMLDEITVAPDFQRVRQPWPSFQAGPLQLCNAALPAPREVPELRVVQLWENDGGAEADPDFRAIEAVWPGHPYFIEAEFNSDQSDETYRVSIEGAGSVLLTQTDLDPSLFRSDVITFAQEPPQ